MPIVPIGLCGNATCGKDSLYDVLSSIFKQDNIETERFALADNLKNELAEFVSRQYGISILTKDLKEKTLIRPIMVEHGRIKRTLTNGKYWTNLLTDRVKESISDGKLPIICDIRYSVYDNDELQWIRDDLGGVLVYIERVLPSGELVPPANIDEKENNLKLIQACDFKIKWATTNNFLVRKDFAETQLRQLIQKIISK